MVTFESRLYEIKFEEFTQAKEKGSALKVYVLRKWPSITLRKRKK